MVAPFCGQHGKKVVKVEKFEFVKLEVETLCKKRWRTQKRSDAKVKLEKNGIGTIELEMGPLKLNHIKQLITLAVITLSCFHCTKLFVVELFVPAERNYDKSLLLKQESILPNFISSETKNFSVFCY